MQAVREVADIPTHEPVLNTDRAGSVRFTPDGRLLYANVEDQVVIVDPVSATVQSVIAMPPESSNVSMAVLSDQQAVTTGDRRIALGLPTETSLL